MEAMLQKALKMIGSGTASCVVLQGQDIVYSADGRGVSPILALYQNDPEKLRDAFVVDKIIGKAAAVLLVLGGVKAAYGEITSAAAVGYLKARGVEIRCGKCVDVITARDGTGVCPIESAVLDIEDPEEALRAIIGRIQALQKARRDTL